MNLMIQLQEKRANSVGDPNETKGSSLSAARRLRRFHDDTVDNPIGNPAQNCQPTGV
jgi:hypothetical protein